MGPLTCFHDVSVIYFAYEIQMLVNEKNLLFFFLPQYFSENNMRLFYK